MWRGVHASLWVGHHAPHTPLQETIYAPIPLRFTPLLPHFYIPYYVSTVFTPLWQFLARVICISLCRFPGFQCVYFLGGHPLPPHMSKNFIFFLSGVRAVFLIQSKTHFFNPGEWFGLLACEAVSHLFSINQRPPASCLPCLHL